MATLEELYARYFPGQDQRGEYDAYNMSYSGGLTPQQLAYKAAQSGNVDDWVFAQQQANIPMGYEDSYAMTGYGPQGPSTFNPLGFYGGQREPVVRDALQAIAQSAGVPNYDWTPAINKMGMQLAAEFGGQSPTSQTRLPELIRRIAVNADPQIQQTYQQIAPQINPVLEDQYTQIWNQSKDYKSDKFKSQMLKVAAIAAIPVAGYFATGGAAGAGAAGSGSGAAAGGVTGAAGELAAGGAAAYGGGASAGAGAAAGATAGTAAGTGATGGTIDVAANLAAAEAGAGAASTNFINANNLMQAGAAAGAAGGGSGGSAAGTTATTEASKQTALGNILNGTGTAADYLTVFGQIAPSLLGMYASDKQSDALGAQAARYEAMGAPYRDRLGQLYSDPTAFLNSPEVKVPVQQGTDALARALSTQGNPAGSGAALQQLQSYASDQLFSRLGQEKDRLGGFGGLTQYQAQAPQIGMAAIGAQGNVYNALGHGIGAVTNPPRSLEDMLKAYNISQGLT